MRNAQHGVCYTVGTRISVGVTGMMVGGGDDTRTYPQAYYPGSQASPLLPPNHSASLFTQNK